jgi:hypothetical protein
MIIFSISFMQCASKILLDVCFHYIHTLYRVDFFLPDCTNLQLRQIVHMYTIAGFPNKPHIFLLSQYRDARFTWATGNIVASLPFKPVIGLCSCLAFIAVLL